MVAMATAVKRKAEMKAGRSPKFSMPMARAPRMIEKLSQERKVRSLAKKTLGSTRVGRAMRLPVVWLATCVDMGCRMGVLREMTYPERSEEEVDSTY